jgi:hypothetical protein
LDQYLLYNPINFMPQCHPERQLLAVVWQMSMPTSSVM